jgi:hypothetical protein
VIRPSSVVPFISVLGAGPKYTLPSAQAETYGVMSHALMLSGLAD